MELPLEEGHGLKLCCRDHLFCLAQVLVIDLLLACIIISLQDLSCGLAGAL